MPRRSFCYVPSYFSARIALARYYAAKSSNLGHGGLRQVADPAFGALAFQLSPRLVEIGSTEREALR